MNNLPTLFGYYARNDVLGKLALILVPHSAGADNERHFLLLVGQDRRDPDGHKSAGSKKDPSLPSRIRIRCGRVHKSA